MHDIEANKNVCRQFFGLLGELKYDEAMQLLHDDIEWWVVGDLDTSGTYHGRQAVTGLFGLVREGCPEGLTVNFTAVTAEEDRVAIEMNSDGVLGGHKYSNVYHMLFWVRDGKIFKTHEYFDTKYTAAFVAGFNSRAA